MTDTTLSVDTVYANGKGISSGDRLILAPDRNITVTFPVDYTHTTSPANNLIVEGQLVSQPDATHTHTFQWTGIDTTKYVGGVSTGALSTDPGTWVLNAGNLLVNGYQRVAWNRTGTDPTWRVGDEVRSVPWNGTGMAVDLDTTALYVPGVDSSPQVDPARYFDLWGDPDFRQYQEIINLTRNVIFRGEVNAESHININMATVPQVFNNVMLQYMGPKDPTVWIPPGATKEQIAAGTAARLAANRDPGGLVKGRWALHFHMMEDGSRGSNPSGVVIRDGRSRAFVTHRSHGVHWYDCLSYRQNAGGYWYDNAENESPNEPEFDAPGDLTYERCGIVVTGGFLIGSVTFNARNHVFDTFTAGMPQNSSSGSGAPGVHDWVNKAFVGSGHAGELGDIWDWRDNVVHNVGGLGIRAWQNEDNQHRIDGAVVFKVKWKNNQRPDGHAVGAMSAGAYRTDYDFVDCIFESGVWDAAASHANSVDLNQYGIKTLPGRNYVRCHFDYKDIGQHVQPSGQPTKYIDCVFHDVVHADDSKPTQTETQRSYDFVRSNIGPPSMDPTGNVLSVGSLTPASIYRFQDVDGNAWELSHGPGAGIRSPVSMAANSNIVVGSVGMFTPADVGQVVLVEHGGPFEPEGTGEETRLPLNATVTGYTDSSHITLSASTPLTVVDPPNAPVSGAISNTNIFFLPVFAKPYTFTPMAQPFALWITTSSLTVGANGSAYSQPLNAGLGQGSPWGTAISSWSIASGTLPTGLSLNATTGLISGTPTQTGNFPITFRVEDNKNVTADRTLTLAIGASASLQITTSSPLPAAILGTPYTGVTVAASGGVPPRTFSIISGSLPAGLSLNASTGAITGTPTVAETRSPTFRVTDSVAATAQRQLSITVQDLNPVISTTSLSEGEEGLAYAGANLTATGGVAPYTFDVQTGPLPAGLALSSSGVWSGTPTTEGTYPLRLRVTDSTAHTGSRDFVIVVYPAFDFPQPGYPAGVYNQPYVAGTPYSGGAPPVLFEIDTFAQGAAPDGISMDTDGNLTGIPTQAGLFVFVVRAFDALDVVISRTVQLEITVPSKAFEVDRVAGRSFALRRPTGGSRQRDRVSS